ncbi:AAA family ATPase [Actinomadura sp. WMMA1423]|uniref:AAA family ATPase n=1 Tax=Actinomadura sp. WMMA1423 TaxID=2591108 RepID=UPI0011479C9D|nr:AAA family ATPase [Actinomadura sp. WMMA1423]
MAENLASVIDEERRRAFVGRTGELAAFGESLGAGTRRRVLLIHGPGGIGKTTLLHQFRMRALAAGRPVVSVDGRDVDCSPEAFRRAAGHAEGGTETVLLLDGYEYLAALDTWIREEFLPSVPAGMVVVLAGREPPSQQWRSDPGWRAVTVCRELAALTSAESVELLLRAGVAAPLTARLAELGRGHPLVLALLADAAAAGPPPDELGEAPDLVAALVRRVVGGVPDEAHATGLAVCAYAWLTTEDLLRRAVGERAAEIWAWLEGRPFIGRGSDGLHAHDLVRDLLAADLRRRSPEAYRRVHRLVHDHAVSGLRRTGGAGDRWLAAHQKVFLLRRTPLAGPVWSLPELRTAAVTPGRQDDHPAVLALIERFEGVQSAAVAARWLAAQPENLVVVRTSAGLAGCAFQCVWPADPALHDADPVLRAALATADRNSPARPGEQISIARYVIGPDGHERDPHAALAASVMSTVDWTTRPLAWSFTATTDPGHWGPIFNYLALTRQVAVASEGLSHTVYGIDWRRLPVERWLDLVCERELTGETGPPPADLLRPAPLDRDRFDQAVRQALLHLNRPDQLTGNPLLGTCLVADPTPACLRAALLAAVDHLAQDPRSLPLRRVLDRTYLHPAPTQEAAAEALHLSFSTYRRHLAKATARLADLLWSQELTGTPPNPDAPPR